MKAKDLIGFRFGRLLVKARAPNVIHPHGVRAAWLCVCDCGETTIVLGQRLRSGQTKSCGCLSVDLSRKRIANTWATNRTHGLSHSPEYNSWDKMLQRCENPKDNAFKNYGGRGIHVCQSWHFFGNFIRDMGPRPPGTTIDRINNNGNYERGNCRWSTRKEQNRNRRDSNLVTYEGKTQTVGAWEEEKGMTPNSLRSRLRAGWTVDRAINTPVHTKLCIPIPHTTGER